MLIILICYCARLRLQILVIKPLHLQRYNFFLTYTKKIYTFDADLMIFFFFRLGPMNLLHLLLLPCFTQKIQ